MSIWHANTVGVSVITCVNVAGTGEHVTIFQVTVDVIPQLVNAHIRVIDIVVGRACQSLDSRSDVPAFQELIIAIKLRCRLFQDRHP